MSQLSKGAIDRLFNNSETWTGGDIAIDDGAVLDVPTGQISGDKGYSLISNTVPTSVGTIQSFDIVYDSGDNKHKAIVTGTSDVFFSGTLILSVLQAIGITIAVPEEDPPGP